MICVVSAAWVQKTSIEIFRVNGLDAKSEKGGNRASTGADAKNGVG